jgi:hypothetical protein
LDAEELPSKDLMPRVHFLKPKPAKLAAEQAWYRQWVGSIRAGAIGG